MAPILRKARAGDVDEIRALIVSENMPAMEVEERLDGFFVLEDEGRLVGCAGLEVYGGSAVLRSVMVVPPLRGSGEGERLTARGLDYARQQGAARCYLFTMTAPGFFARFGFERCTLDDFDADARESWQWRGISKTPELREMLTPMRADL